MTDNSRQDMHDKAEALLDRGNVSAARSLYIRICEIAPDDADAWLMLGLIDSEAGNDRDALSALRTAAELDPGLADAHFNLTVLLANTGDLTAAVESCQRAVQIDPGYGEAWILLGALHGRQGDFHEAANCSRRALAIEPGSIEAAANLGMALVSNGNCQEALQLYAHAVRQHPDNSLFWTALGDVCLALGKRNDALHSFQRATDLEPGNQRVLQALAGLYLELGQPDKASAACCAVLVHAPDHVATLGMLGTANQMMGNLYEAADVLGRAVTLQPDNPENTYKLACACQALGNLDMALTQFTRTLELEPGSATAIGGLARVHEQKGDTEAVKRLLPDLLEAADRNPLALPTLASIAAQYGIEDISLGKLTQSLNRVDIPDAVRARLHWAAGTLLDRLGDFNAAFDHHRAAKALTSARYDAGAHSALVDRIIATFSREFFDAAPRPTQVSELPVFIVGMPRSGTSLVEQILASHAQVFGAGELDTLSRTAQTLPRRLASHRRFPECCRELTTETLDSAGMDYLAVIRRLSSDAARVTDKMPHNFLHLGLIQLLFPGARIIHVRRNPLDTCLSCYFQEFSNAHAYTRSLDDLGAHYRDYQRLMEHWKQVLRMPLLHLRYEELVEEPDRMMRTLTEFCELPWDPACAEFYMSNRVVATLSSSQVREPLNRKSIGKWKRYQEHLKPLLTYLGTT